MQELDPDRIVRLEEDGPCVVLLDQRRLPDGEVELVCTTAANPSYNQEQVSDTSCRFEVANPSYNEEQVSDTSCRFEVGESLP